MAGVVAEFDAQHQPLRASSRFNIITTSRNRKATGVTIGLLGISALRAMCNDGIVRANSEANRILK